MAEEHGMIEPFEPKLIREKDNQKIVSYGASSYGYDIRCANEFKVFTNINSTIVDPKNFDPNSFVEVDVMVTTANSWVEITFDMTGTPTSFDRMVLFPGWGVANAVTFYIDDILQD